MAVQGKWRSPIADGKYQLLSYIFSGGIHMKLFEHCVNCTERYVGCHSKCEIYLKDKARLDRHNNLRAKAKEQEYNNSRYFKSFGSK